MFLFSDLISLAIAFAYVALLIGTAEMLRRVFHVPIDITRKIVHVGVGMTALVVTSFFRDWSIAILGPLAFLAINYFSYRKKIFQGIEIAEEGQLGTIYFPLAFVILIPALWSHPARLAASFMPMTWGDAAAAILGKRFGAHPFRVFGQTSSVEGSIAMFGFGFIATEIALVMFGQPPGSSLAIALVTALAATIAEALSPKGIDNLSVPIVSALVLNLLAK
jgi:phytol kinase